MADRVHPRDSPPTTYTQTAPERPPPALPQPGTYVVQIPKDQVYRVPPPENARRYENYTRRNPARRRRRSCFCWLIALVASLIVLTAGVFYLIVRPESPDYSVEKIAFQGFNLDNTTSSSSSIISPSIDVTVRAENPNRRIGIHYERDSSAEMFYGDNIQLCQGVLPAFYQPEKNVTEVQTELKGSGIKLTSAAQKALLDAQSQGKVALKLKLKAPVRIKVVHSLIKTWTITVKVDCDLTVDKLTARANIVSKKCDYRVHFW